MDGITAVLSGSPAAGVSVLDGAVKESITKGINDMVATYHDVLLLVIGATVTVIALSAGVNFALRKLAGVLSHAQ